MSEKHPHNQVDALDRALALADENAALYKKQIEALIFMAQLSWAKDISTEQIVRFIGSRHHNCFLRVIAPSLRNRSEIYRRRALTLTFCLIGIEPSLVAQFMSITPRQVRRLQLRLRQGEYDRLFKQKERLYKYEDKQVRERLFEVLHAPPSAYNINRTTWTIDLLHDVLKDEGTLIGKNGICEIIKDEGYAFRKTREVLTSNDPSYREKLQKITRTLRRLGPLDRFFSIDEYGPVSIRERGGRRRVRAGEKPTVPQFQKSKGTVIVTAALELSSNQITHFYSEKKDTAEMIKLLYLLLNQYQGCRRLYLSWDAASWHSSKVFVAEVKQVNRRDYRRANGTATVKLRPLPARAQFLNVIESVFSGISTSIIHNSNYGSVEEMRLAIDRYVSERNEHFRLNPHRRVSRVLSLRPIQA